MAMGCLKARWLHIKSIGKPWWLLVGGVWGAFWAADAMIAKYGSHNVKNVWDKYTLHMFFDWRTGVIGLLAITLLLVIEGSFRYVSRLIPPDHLVMAEEDPKIYMEAMNNDFIKLGYVPFKFSNKGQRVNPAQGITVQPIKELPFIVFDYIDCLDPAAEKVVIPKAKNQELTSAHNILIDLQTAWQEAEQAGTLENADLPFKVTIFYRDAKQRKFKSEVSFKYFPLEEDHARESCLSSQPSLDYSPSL